LSSTVAGSSSRASGAAATFYEQNADAYYDGMHITLNMYGAARHTLYEMVQVFGQSNNSYHDRNITVSRQFNEQITLSVFAPRDQACRLTRARILPVARNQSWRPENSPSFP
jgi:hypothetical protein